MIIRGNVQSLQEHWPYVSSSLNDYYNGHTFLYVACMCGRLEVVKFLVSQKGIDVNKGAQVEGNE